MMAIVFIRAKAFCVNGRKAARMNFGDLRLVRERLPSLSQAEKPSPPTRPMESSGLSVLILQQAT